MKLQISFDTTNLEHALQLAHNVYPYTSAFKIGTPLLYLHGTQSVKKFKETFPDKTLIVDCKISDCSKESVPLFADAGADWITVLAGTEKQVIHSACTIANNMNVQVLLDLIDSASFGQSALESRNLGVSALLFNRSYQERNALIFFDEWQMVQDNTDLPIYLETSITRNSIQPILEHIQPYSIVIGKAITTADNPAEEASYFSDLIAR